MDTTEYLLQPAQMSDFVNQVTLNTCCDVSPFTVFNIMYSLELVDCDGEPTDLAKFNGLPDNTELAHAIGRAGEAHEGMVTNHNVGLIIAAKQARLEPYSKQWEDYQRGMEFEGENVIDYGMDYEHRFIEVYDMINK